MIKYPSPDFLKLNITREQIRSLAQTASKIANELSDFHLLDFTSAHETGRDQNLQLALMPGLLTGLHC